MNIKVKVGRKALMGVVSLVAVFLLTACGGGQGVNATTLSPMTSSSATLDMTPVEPTTAFDDIPVSENPYMWVSSTSYDGDWNVAGLNLDLRNPIPEVQDHVEAVATLGNRCTVVLLIGTGVAPETFGVAIYDNPKDLASMDFTGGMDATQADAYVHSFDEVCGV